MKLVLATDNRHKAAEMAALLAGHELLARPAEVGEVDETAPTLEGNARLKAEAVAAVAGLPSVADDTGLEVVALGGAPGVHSARYAGPAATYADNVTKLLAAMDGVVDRRARFRTVALVRFPDGSEVVASGAVAGTITTAPRGSDGFGYDPVFVPDEGDGRTFAEMAATEKNALSHRGRAFAALDRALATRQSPQAP